MVQRVQMTMNAKKILDLFAFQHALKNCIKWRGGS